MNRIAIIMGSNSDYPTMKEAELILDYFNLEFDSFVVSAHRTPEKMFEFAKNAHKSYDVIIAGAGGAAHLPGMVASLTTLPVIGVPIKSKALKGMDSLLSIAQMPGGVPVATMSIGKAGAKNAGILAAKIIGTKDQSIVKKLEKYQLEQIELVEKMELK